MTRRFLMVFLALSACGRPNSADTADHRAAVRKALPVLMYHEVRRDRLANAFDVSSGSFERQLDWLQEHGYSTLSMTQLQDAFSTGTQPAKAVVLTFDDGYLQNFTVAAPLLRERGMKATFFVHTVGRDQSGSGAYPKMTWAQLRELDADPLFEVQSHSVSHPNLTALSQADLDKEMRDSRTALERQLGGTRTFFSFPMGHYDSRVIDAARAAGYTMAFAVQDRGLFDRPTEFSVPRIYVGRVMDDLDFFAGCVTGYANFEAECFAERWAPIQ